MAVRDVDAILYVMQIPEIWFEEGHFHVSFDVGRKAQFEFVFSPNTFFEMRTKSAAIVDEFHEGRGNVSQIRRRH